MEIAIALIALTLMEIVLGIDNIVFITIATGKLPEEQQPMARKLGLGLALVSRLLLLATLSYLVQNLTSNLFYLTSLGIPESLISRFSSVSPEDAKEFMEANGISVRDLILLAGGLFLIGKSVFEIHDEMNPEDHNGESISKSSLASILIQIAILDIVFSLDSVITAVGMVDDLWVMASAIVIAVVVMLIFAEAINRFVKENPTIKLLALSFLILIGVTLVAEGIGSHFDKGYVYFAMFFALIMEFLNMVTRKRRQKSTAQQTADG
jgi:predicted tellurium resistance membrane protein TerC